MKINGKTYKTPELNFNSMCDLEDMGIQIKDMGKKPLTTIRGFLALALNGDSELAGQEIAEHLTKGGKLDDLSEELNKAVSESDFFRALNKDTAEGNPESENEKA